MKNAFFSTITNELASRAAMSTLSLVSPASADLREQLSSLMNAPPGAQGSFLAPPVCEALFDWERAPVTMNDLVTSGLLPLDLVSAMDAPPAKYLEDRFARTWHPYRHQLAAWEALSERDPRSVIVTTGTASGKTECFLVPILADLDRELQTSPRPLEGVRALFLYPLNALINSQRDRLLAWTHAYGERLRFCLYNGATPHEVTPLEQSDTPSEVWSRKLLHKNPPPILVTNATMLEFMMVRSEDAPIVERSKGKLRWVVLDEAHTYVGSAAAEIALLLRRVLHAFDVAPSDVRFVATSATIGTGEETRRRLQNYLADLAGVPPDRVVVIGGARSRPGLPPEVANETQVLPSSIELADLEPADVGRRLAASPSFRAARALLQEGPQRIERVAETLGLEGPRRNQETVALLDHASYASLGADHGALLPIRMHLFMRTQPGIFACCNSRCSGRTVSSVNDWNFGRAYLERRNRCEHCHSLVFPLVLCSGCGEAYLSAREEGNTLFPAEWSGVAIDDDEALEDDGAEESPRDELEGRPRLLAGPTGRDRDVSPSAFDPASGAIGTGSTTSCVFYEPPIEKGVPRCGRCGEKESATRELFRGVRAGAAFLLGVAIPSVLEQLPPDDEGAKHPAAGRKLITFTDSRGGTARFALKSQLEAERNYVRALIYHKLWERAAPQDANTLEETAQLRAQLEMPGLPPLLLRAARAQLAAFEAAQRAPEISWDDVRTYLANEKVVAVWMRESLRARYPGVTLSEREMADIVMLRELMRRPKRQNSLETLGLARLRYPALDRTIHDAPPSWLARGLSVTQWVEFLEGIVDFFVRSHGAVAGLDNSLLRWMGIRFGQPVIVAPGEDGKRNVAYPWPTASEGKRPHRIARLLALALRMDTANRADRDEMNTLLERAWRDVLTSRLLEQSSEGYRLDLRASVLTPVVDGFICPITRRVLASTFLGFSPFQTERWASSEPCAAITMPRLRYPFATEHGRREPEKVRAWLQEDSQVVAARAAGVWTDFSDRIATFPDSLYFQTGEHSAQQSKVRLDQLEKSFRKGDVNVLSCSTTMEMGVNLGGLMAVALNNTPPGPANYLQRAGRAARRGQSRAVALTMCQGTAHGEAVFKDPMWPFTAPLTVPAVSLRSDRIVVRHIHSLLLSYFLRARGVEDAQRLTSGAFLVNEEGDVPPIDQFVAWIEGEAPGLEPLREGLDHLLVRTSLDGVRAGSFEIAATSLIDIRDRWRAQYDALKDELAQAGGQPRKNSPSSAIARAISIQMTRLTDEYLLRFLATEGFLPAYGFPLHVVPFVTTTAEQLRGERERGEDSYGQVRGYPSRHVSQALNEYAPGNSIVLDGVVYKSSGVTLSWHRPPQDQGEQREIQAFRTAWRCRVCGAAGSVLGGTSVASCARCGKEDIATVRYLVPSGFAVDIRATPHNDVSQVEYIPRIPAWLSAGSKPWANLSTSQIGRYRYDADGFIFHHSRGITGHGYAICLHCGYAAAEPHRAGSAEAAMLPKGFERHRRLRGGKGEDQQGNQCVGAAGGFGVRRHHQLGSDARTDIIELQLASPSGDFITDESVATSIAVALREAHAREMGVDVREIGWHVQHGAPRDGRRSILLFDVAEGGAGYEGAVPDLLPQLLRRAQQFLSCPRGCDSACHACLLAYDTAEFVDLLNRRAALDFVTDELVLSASLPPTHQVFGEKTRFEPAGLTKACLLVAQQVGLREVRIYVDGTGNEASLDPSWPLWPFLVRWRTQGFSVQIVVTWRLLEALSWQEVNAFANQLEGAQIELRRVDAPLMVGDRFVALEMGTTQRAHRWAVSDVAMLCPGEDWGEPTETGDAVAVHLEEPLGPSPGQLLATSDVRVAVPGTVVVINAGEQLNGLVGGFGSRLFGQVGRQAPVLMARLGSVPMLTSVTYSDRYLKSPLSVRLLAEVLRHLTTLPGGLGPDTQVTVRSSFDYRDFGRAQGMTSNWPSADLQGQVAERVIEVLTGKKATVEVGDKFRLPHHRFLRLEWADGRASELRFDQGLSGMQVAGRALPFDTSGPVARQAQALAQISLNVVPYSSDAAPIYVIQP